MAKFRSSFEKVLISKLRKSTRDRCVDKLNISYGAQTRLVYPDPADHPVYFVVLSVCMGQ